MDWKKLLCEKRQCNQSNKKIRKIIMICVMNFKRTITE